MPREVLRHWGLGVVLLLAAVAAARQPATTRCAGPQFEIVFEQSVSDEPFNGRVYVVLTKREHLLPATLVDWIDAEPFFARDVQDWQVGETLIFTTDNCLSYPHSLAELAPDTYRVQAVMRLNDWSQDPINAPGNGYSDVAVFRWTGEQPVTVRLHVARTFPPPRLVDHETRKFVSLRSERLSAFHGRDVFLRAAVGLPDAYLRQADRRFPTVYAIPGFAGTLERANVEALVAMLAMHGLDAVVVYLDASCPTGHHVFADSANNGPWGTALVTELIPHLETQFRLIPEPGARYLTGHSSGGWSSLWLQITHPDTFGGVWSTSPDPVDFTAFMQINIYEADANLYYAKDGTPVYLTRPGAFGLIRAEELCALETVLGRGGQMGSFEAVFSPRGADGQPARLWDRTSGRIDPAVAAAWRKYDICRVLESNWPVLGPKLAGKLHIFCGEQDDFFLEQGVRKLADLLEKLGSDEDVAADLRVGRPQVEIIPGASHMLPPRVFAEITRQMAARFERYDKNRQGG